MLGGVKLAKEPYAKKISGTGLMKKIKDQRWLLLMVLPGIIWMIIFCYLPIYGTQIAFQNYKVTDIIGSSAWVGFKYFTKFFSDPMFFTVMKNTLGISLLKLAFGFTLPIVFALLLNEITGIRFKKIVQTISYLPHFLSWVVLGGIMINWLSDTGFFNELFMGLGLIDQPISFLARPQYFWAISVISEVWKELGWGAIIYLAAIAGIDQSLYEAAAIDGAGRMQRLIKITLPSITGTIAILFILSVGNILGSNFDQILVLRNQLNSSASSVIDIFVYQTGIIRGNYSYASAIGLFRSVFSLLLLLIANKVTSRLEGSSLF